MLSAILGAAIVLYVAYFALTSIQAKYKHHRQAQAWECQDPRRVQAPYFGVAGLVRSIKAYREKRLLTYIGSIHDEYGNTFRQSSPIHAITSTIEPENVKTILATKFNDFGLGTRHRQFYPLLGDGIFTLDGPGWSHARALLRPQFAREQVADIALLNDHVTSLIDLIPKDRSGFDIQRLFFLLTIDSATHFLFGESVGALESGTSKGSILNTSAVGGAAGFAEEFNKSQDYLAIRSIAQNLYWVINPKEFQEANRKVHEVVDYYVNLALQARASPSKELSGDRYIFLNALAAETQDPKILRDSMLNILLAGRDTTASLLSSTFYYLARHPATWNKLRQEIVKVFGDSRQPLAEITQAKLRDITYLRHVLNEVLRLLPPVPMNFRVANKDTSLPVGGGRDGTAPVYVKKGDIVAYSVYNMHRRTDFWGEDSHLFRPERWEENAKHGWDYLPFNGGPRICLGQQYALTEASYTIVRLMQHFDTLKNADPDTRKEPVLLSNLTLSHDQGVLVNLFSSHDA
ncbi:putative cytochrome P450 alkane hydroxylase [Talaromyces proteolyticus]|uniref:Cytochrome P450 alkane hydroxylase n=1 Tax=Talaromyces proteolyticus TaxID=1131652 RepID=A0AAD4KGV3_9EURO|nr:putative cytochrome P450 alkane hydroxylase [Talaromyces proteolyticus]KAH8691466.1 putative cytochrome P450 alkane hydroxylase [Talaromyces proteolyticus]